jgi:hypothetical protein
LRAFVWKKISAFLPSFFSCANGRICTISFFCILLHISPIYMNHFSFVERAV